MHILVRGGRNKPLQGGTVAQGTVAQDGPTTADGSEGFSIFFHITLPLTQGLCASPFRPVARWPAGFQSAGGWGRGGGGGGHPAPVRPNLNRKITAEKADPPFHPIP